MTYHGIKWQKKPSGIWKKGQDDGMERGKMGRKQVMVWAMWGKRRERERGREREEERD